MLLHTNVSDLYSDDEQARKSEISRNPPVISEEGGKRSGASASVISMQ
ncbi:hypothetical protein [Pseudomonas nitroreducens]|nr:hypothetical protein [Pseudomonas nitroreducens]MCP1650176.1 hypothetical protein [Pseudomonas nitroreducens]MCP1687954.1 hypothetical protein [Pseudomonas nitroreducens]